MAHLALYRAWRPQTFGDMVGQQHMVQTIQNAIRENRLSHTYLFCGPRGTGKTSAAKILAKAVNCEQEQTLDPCNSCQTCKRMTAGSVMDVIEIDAASNRGIEEIRDIRDKVKYVPTEVRKKVYIIDEVHMLTAEAFNALLKILEEPPEHVLFILATTEPHKLPATIISRCQRFDFRRIELADQIERMQQICQEEDIRVEDAALSYIARLSDGSMRDALSLLDQMASFAEGQITLIQAIEVTGGLPVDQFRRIAMAIRQQDAGLILTEVDLMMRAGKSADQSLEKLMYYFRDLLLLQLAPSVYPSSGRMTHLPELQQMADEFSKEHLFAIINLLNHYQNEMKQVSFPQAIIEVALLKLCTQSSNLDNGSAVMREINELKSNISSITEQLRVLQSKEQVDQVNRTTGSRGEFSRKKSTVKSDLVNLSVKKDCTNDKMDRLSGLTSNRMQQFVLGRSSLEKVEKKWAKIMQKIKQERVTVHAWLADGRPVSYADGEVLVAFKNTIHRETTERSDNREIIERALTDCLAEGTRLVTVMQKDWQDILFQDKELSLPDTETLPSGCNEDAELVEEAIRLFGKQVVTIKE